MVCSVPVLVVVMRVELDTELGMPVEDVLPWLDGGDDETVGDTSWLEVVEDVTRVEPEETEDEWLLEDRLDVVEGREDVVTTALLDVVLLTWMLVEKVGGTEEVSIQEQAAETRLTPSSSLYLPQSLRYFGISLGSVMVAPNHLTQSVTAALRFLLSIILL